MNHSIRQPGCKLACRNCGGLLPRLSMLILMRPVMDERGTFVSKSTIHWTIRIGTTLKECANAMPWSPDRHLDSVGLRPAHSRVSFPRRSVPSQMAREDSRLTEQHWWFWGSQRSPVARAIGGQWKQMIRREPSTGPLAAQNTEYTTVRFSAGFLT